ncbi:MAG: hypothetical protein AAGJ86_07620 [Pseudomonadota bacterium]
MTSIEAKNVNHPNHRENLNETKYQIIRDAMHAVLPATGGMTFKAMEDAVKRRLSDDERTEDLFPKPGSIRWYCKAVQLDLEARGEIERIAKVSPMQLRRVSGRN